jgi:hypothetical protein
MKNEQVPELRERGQNEAAAGNRNADQTLDKNG